jgi:uncharacterized BrkB/YihY/UPF0761 family membrane protein
LNRLWKVTTDRSYLMNQAVGFSLTVFCVLLGMTFVVVNAVIRFVTTPLFAAGGSVVNFFTLHAVPAARVPAILNFILLRIEGAVFFFVVILAFYRFLPNKKIKTAEVLPAAILAGVMVQVVQTLYVLLVPFLDLRDQWGSQGSFYLPVNFLLLTYFETFVVLGCAFLATDAQTQPWLSGLFQRSPIEEKAQDEQGRVVAAVDDDAGNDRPRAEAQEAENRSDRKDHADRSPAAP